jgi:hypothetical protein
MRVCVGLAFVLLVACADETGGGPRIDGVTPGVAAPGDEVTVDGRGFAGEAGLVAVGGRPVEVEAWAARRVVVRLPADLPTGVADLVVTAAGRPSAPASIEITGGTPRVRPPRRFPPESDGGVEADAATPRDAGPDAGQDLVAVFQPDPVAGGVALAAVDSAPGELRLEVRLPSDLPPLHGVAFHLAYDGNVLRFVEATPAPDARFLVKEIGPGRLALGRVLDGPPPAVLATLRFRLVGRGEGRLEFPERDRALRDPQNRPVAAIPWAAGSVRSGP